VQLLLGAKAAVDATDANRGGTALNDAAFKGHAAILQLLLDAKAAVGAADAKSRTALHWAATKGHAMVARMLIEAKAAVDVADIHGATPLQWAAQGGSAAVMQMLLDARAAVNASDAGATTALHKAAWQGHNDVVQLLLNAGADVNKGDVNQKTPLHYAARAGRTQTVQLLLAAPQLTLQATTGAARTAAKAGHAELAKIVLRAVMARDMAAVAELLDEPTLAAEVLRQWQAAEANVREQEARWPALQQLLVGVAGAHQQLRAATAEITAPAISTAAAEVQAAATETVEQCGAPQVAPAGALKRTAQSAVGAAEQAATVFGTESVERLKKRQVLSWFGK
jgi:hypothetical protein